MTDLTVLYPDRELDMVAVSSLGVATGTGSINYAYIGGHIAALLGEGIQGAMAKGRKAFDKVVGWTTDRWDGIDDQFFYDLGRQEKPFWGSDEWNRTLVPAGYVDRFDAASDVTVMLLGFFLARIILGKVGLGGITKFAGGLYGSFTQRKWKGELRDSMDDILDALENPDRIGRMSNFHELQMNSTHDLTRGMVEGWAYNTRQPLIEMLNQLKATQLENKVEL